MHLHSHNQLRYKLGWLFQMALPKSSQLSESDYQDQCIQEILYLSWLEMSFMRIFREFMMKVSIEMLVKIKQEIRCGIGAEGDDSSVQFFIDSTMHDFDNSRLMMHK